MNKKDIGDAGAHDRKDMSEVADSFQTPETKTGHADGESSFSKTMEGFKKDDIKSPSIGLAIDRLSDLKVLPGKILKIT